MQSLWDLVKQMKKEENAYNVGVFYDSYNTWRQDQLWVW